MTQLNQKIVKWRTRARAATDPWEARRCWREVLALDPYHAEALAHLQDEPTPSSSAVASVPKKSKPRHVKALSRTLFSSLRRLVPIIGIPLVVVFLTFYLLTLANQMAAIQVTGSLPLPFLEIATDERIIDRVREESTTFIMDLARFDLGVNETSDPATLPRPISTILAESVGKSMGLLAVSLLIAVVIGTALGVGAALKRHSSLSTGFLLLSIIGTSIPSFFAAILLHWALLEWMRLTGQGRPPLPLFGFGWDRHIILPALVLAARPLAQIARVSAIALGDVLDQDFVRTARSKGLAAPIVLGRHVLRNAAIPILTTVGLSLRFSLSSLPVVELFFGWPGVGMNLVLAIEQRSDRLIVTYVFLLSLLIVAVNVLLDASYRTIDPRLKQLEAPRLWRREGLGSTLTGWASELKLLITDNIVVRAVRRLLRRDRSVGEPRPVVAQHDPQREVTLRELGRARWRRWWRGIAFNPTLLIGAALVGALLFVYFAGPSVTPRSPYQRSFIDIADGVISTPPYEPGTDYRWGSDFLGRDMLSLLLVGAQRTLFVTAIVVLCRMLLGVGLGLLAGWLKGGWLDRLILAISEVISAVPALILVWLLILALGIEQGLRPFIIAFAVVGWTEVMQYVRSEVHAIRAKPYIESALSIGLRTPRLLISHVLPNVMPALFAMAALEMGAVLMLLGELGYIGVFIGGGQTTAPGLGIEGILYSNIPEWASLLANVREYTRGYTWMALTPATAFFLAILAFNLFGEGARRLIDNVGINLLALRNRYLLGVAVLLFLLWGWQHQGGDATLLRRQAELFDVEQAQSYYEALSADEMRERPIGSRAHTQATTYVADQFKSLELQRAGSGLTYYQGRPHDIRRLNSTPELEIDGTPLAYGRDFAVYPSYYENQGEVTGPVRLVTLPDAFDERERPLRQSPNYLFETDFSGEILLLLDPTQLALLSHVPFAGALVVAENPDHLSAGGPLGTQVPTDFTLFNEEPLGERPIAWISVERANQLLERIGLDLASAREEQQGLALETIESQPLDVEATLVIDSQRDEISLSRSVLAQIPSYSHEWDDKAIVVMSRLDTPLGSGTPAASDTLPAGPAIMLETAATLQAAQYQPYKPLYFTAYAGEGQSGGAWANTLPSLFIAYEQNPLAVGLRVRSMEIQAGIFLDNIVPQADGILVFATDDERLAGYVEEAAQNMDVPVERRDQVGSPKPPFVEQFARPASVNPPNTASSSCYYCREDQQRPPPMALDATASAAATPTFLEATPLLYLSWEAELSSSDDAISTESLDQTGRVLSYLLMRMAQDTTPWAQDGSSPP